MDNLVVSVGVRIKYFRLEKRFTQKMLADKIGVSSQVISNWERGYSVLTIEDLFKLCKVLDVSSDSILF